jgi:hypothetical protein
MDDGKGLPFLVRKMLNFEQQIKFELVLNGASPTPEDLVISGATREGLFSFRMKTDAGQILTEAKFQVPDIPIWISVFAPIANLRRGDCWASVRLRMSENDIHQLCSGYIYGKIGITWPAVNFEKPEPIEGHVVTSLTSSPGAGDEFDIDFASKTSNLVKVIKFTFVTDANVADRTVALLLDVGNIEGIRIISATPQAAGLTKTYHCFANSPGGAVAGNGAILMPLPAQCLIQGGGGIKSVTENLQAGDYFANIYISAEVFRYL